MKAPSERSRAAAVTGSRILCLVISAGVASGCSAFRGSRSMDMTPFAENTSMMFADAAQVARPFRTVYLKPFMDIPEMAEGRKHAVPILRGLRGLVLYSNQLVALNVSSKSGREKNALLADYLQEAATSVGGAERLSNIRVSAADLDSTLASIRAAKTFLDGIGAASPVVNAFVSALLDGLDQIHAELPMMVTAIDRGIEFEYRYKRVAYTRLTQQHAQYLIAAAWLYESRSGSSAAVDSLLQTDPSLRAFIPAPDRVTRKELDAAETNLIETLDRIDRLIGQLADEKVEYMKTKQELLNLRTNAEQRVKLARDAVVVWGQSHRNLGMGIAVPPMIDLGAMAGGAARSALSSFP